MKTLLLAIFTLLTTTTFAQEAVVWQGGTPGSETNWDEPRNWSTNNVPDEFSDVFIDDVSTSTFSFPIIERGTIELNSLRIASTARLEIKEKANVMIYGYIHGLVKENVSLDGTLLVMNNQSNPQFETITFTSKN